MHPYLERLERGAAKAEGATVAPLTVADVLKRTASYVEATGRRYCLQWDDRRYWVIFDDEKRIFESPDEAAACAEFLRLTGGESK